jgi:hypothetical protein
MKSFDVVAMPLQQTKWQMDQTSDPMRCFVLFNS